MKYRIGLIVAALVSGTMLGQRPAETPVSGAAAPAAPALSPTPTPTPSLVENIIKLWKANLSEDFLKKYISGSELAKDLSAEDIVRLRNAGLPESLISAVSEHKAVAAVGGMPAATPGAVPAVTLVPVPTPTTTARWEGLSKRNPGIVILKSRWDTGVLEFKDETLRWTDARDASKNVLLTAKQITEQQLTCLKKAGGNECFEWVVKSKDQGYRFRDVAWEQGENAKAQEVFRFMKALYPNLVSSQVPVDEK